MFSSSFPNFLDFIELIDRHRDAGLFHAALLEYGFPNISPHTFSSQPRAACTTDDYQRWFAAVRSRNAAKDGTE